MPMSILSTSVRLNRKDGSSEMLSHRGALPWILPSDESVDLALVPLGLDVDSYDYMTVPYTLVADDGSSLSEGMQIILSGYFYQFPGEKRIEPIVREGILAMIPDEELLTTTRRKGKLYLGDVHSFHGNSGSPVFVDVGGLRNGMFGSSYKLLGVISGGYIEDEDFNLTMETTLRGKTQGNSGIAMIVPAVYLKNLLNDPRLVAAREAEVARLLKLQGK